MQIALHRHECGVDVVLAKHAHEVRRLRERDALVERVPDEERQIRVIRLKRGRGPHRLWTGLKTRAAEVGEREGEEVRQSAAIAGEVGRAA